MRALFYLGLTLPSGGLLAPLALALAAGVPWRRGALAALGLLPFWALVLWKPFLWAGGIYLLAEGVALAWTAGAGAALAGALLLAQVAAGVGGTLLVLAALGQLSALFAAGGAAGVLVALALVGSVLPSPQHPAAQDSPSLPE